MAEIGAWFETAKAWIQTMDEVALGVVEGVYVVGSIALQDWQPHSSDIDIIAITAEPADDEMSGTLRTAHAVFTERMPDARVDGPFLAWGDLTLAPVGVARPWTLDGVFHHDAECFEINPVTWFTLAMYGVSLRGPQPNSLQIPLDTEERRRFVRNNANSYWAGVLTDLRGAIGELAPDATLPSSVPQWCLLGATRMLYTVVTGDVASKSAAGSWAAERLGAPWAAVIDEVVELRSEPSQEVGGELLRASAEAMAEALRRIRITT